MLQQSLDGRTVSSGGLEPGASTAAAATQNRNMMIKMGGCVSIWVEDASSAKQHCSDMLMVIRGNEQITLDVFFWWPAVSGLHYKACLCCRNLELFLSGIRIYVCCVSVSSTSSISLRIRCGDSAGCSLLRPRAAQEYIVKLLSYFLC